MNKVIIIGRLTKDPNVTEKVTRFTVAVDRKFKTDGQPTADFISCVAFGKTAEFVSKYFKQGMKVVVEGRIQTGSYEKDGVKHYTTDVIAESVEFAESKKVDEPQDTPNDWLPPESLDTTLPFK